ncbi:8962_t:CDS:1, partial [Paraglomus occultum]
MFRIQCTTLLRHVKLPRQHIFHARALSITTTRFSNFDGLVLGVYKDGSLSEASANDIPSATKEAIQNQLKLSKTKGKFGEVRTLYGLEGLADQVALVSLKEKDDKQELSKALEKARKAV